MKAILFGIAIAAFTFTACTENSTQSKEAVKTNDTSTSNSPLSTTTNQQSASVDEAVTAYLQLKNALTVDNGKDAASAGKQLNEAIQKLDNASFSAEQKKVYDDVKDDMKEHAQHIGNNGDKIAHQREHFDMLSNEMYDLVKAVKPSQTLYKDRCPMFNEKKGAIWLSEVKDIRNPYYGNKMLTCGEQQEEIK